MEEQHTADDQSHYEISLTAGQAFIAFVLLLLSLAASFAFGLMIGKGQADERLVVRKETPAAVTEASVIAKKSEGRIVELGVADNDFQAPATSTDAAASTDTTATTAVIEEGSSPAPATATAPATPAPAPAPGIAAPSTPAPTSATTAPVFAQLLSTSDQKTAEALAAKLIDRGFTSAYVVRGTTDKGPVFRVRVRFASDGEARAAETKLHEFSNDVWITK
jgi:cell division septation protein DedD